MPRKDCEAQLAACAGDEIPLLFFCLEDPRSPREMVHFRFQRGIEDPCPSFVIAATSSVVLESVFTVVFPTSSLAAEYNRAKESSQSLPAAEEGRHTKCL